MTIFETFKAFYRPGHIIDIIIFRAARFELFIDIYAFILLSPATSPQKRCCPPTTHLSHSHGLSTASTASLIAIFQHRKFPGNDDDMRFH